MKIKWMVVDKAAFQPYPKIVDAPGGLRKIEHGLDTHAEALELAVKQTRGGCGNMYIMKAVQEVSLPFEIDPPELIDIGDTEGESDG